MNEHLCAPLSDIPASAAQNPSRSTAVVLAVFVRAEQFLPGALFYLAVYCFRWPKLGRA